MIPDPSASETSPKVVVLRTAGTNCDEETAHAFRLAGGDVETLHVGVFVRRERQLEEFQILALPGGFSYGDDLGAGTVLASRLHSRLAGELQAFVDSGRLVLGICNGFQVLVRLGLLPGWGGEKAVSLVENTSGKFEDRWVTLRVDTESCAFLERPRSAPSSPERQLRLPVAHKEGRFVVRDDEILARLERDGHIALTYVAPGVEDEDFASEYPYNPNGSAAGIAGITNREGNVLGLMPHPERHLRLIHDPRWTRMVADGKLPADEERAGDGYAVFENAIVQARNLLPA